MLMDLFVLPAVRRFDVRWLAQTEPLACGCFKILASAHIGGESAIWVDL